MGAAVAVGASVIGGVVGLNQQKKQANAQKKMLAQEEASRRLQADLQLFSLRQQRATDTFQDLITDAALTQSYMSTKATLDSQQLLNTINSREAQFAAQVQGATNEASQILATNQAKRGQADARQQLEQQAQEAYLGADAQQRAAIDAVLQQLSQSGNQNALATLLDFAESAGGVNEAIAMLTGRTDTSEVERAGNDVLRAGDSASNYKRLATDVKNTSQALVDTDTNLALAQAEMARGTGDYQTALALNDALTAENVNNTAFEAARAANEAQFGIVSKSNAVQRQARYLNSVANENVLQQGQVIGGQILEAQQSAVRSPGFFDYLNVGLGGYNTYQAVRK